jgi:two-component system, LuxR family, response regulator FixJ
MNSEPTVYVVDDDAGALRSMCWLIQQAGLPVRAFRSGREFLDAYRNDEPGCLVLDLRMPDLNGLEVQQRLLEAGQELPIIFITAHGDVPSCARALKSGAIDFLEKPVDGKVLLDHIRTALALEREQIERKRLAAEVAERLSQLTPREREVLDQLVSGKTLKEIAALNDVTVQTIWKQREAIFRKMRVQNEVDLVRLAGQWMGQDRSYSQDANR